MALLNNNNMAFQQVLMHSLTTHGGRLAIENNGDAISYTQLLHKANSITYQLLSESWPRETFIGIETKDRASMVIAMIGIMNAGYVFVPLNPELPAKRKENMVADLGLQRILLEPEIQTIFKRYPTCALKPEDYPRYEDDDSIYVYFTSGSTGKPKGIIGRNKSLLQFVQWELDAFAIQEDCRVSQLISPFFDAFLRDVFVPLLKGGTLCLPPNDTDLFSPAKLGAWLESSGVNLIHCVPSVFRLINEFATNGLQFINLQHIMLSGEKISPLELRKWYQLFGSRIQLVNFYGATETTMIRSFYLIQPEDANLSKIPIGKPIADTKLWVLNKNGKPCADFIPGDLYIASPYMSKGYLNDEALNKEKFVQLFPGTPSECTAFKTGDKARITEDGKIDLLGREDRQLKIRGIRVELDEIEHTILHSGIFKNVLVLHKSSAAETSSNHPEAEDSILAFVILKADAPEQWADQLTQHLKDHLPDFMIPSSVLAVDAYPLLPNGKINYQELLLQQVRQEVVKPTNATEDKLLQIWKDILGDKEISTEESFQQAGGNSLSIMRLIAKIYKEYQVRISLNELFNHLTIKSQANLIQKIQQDASLHIKPVQIRDAYACSAAQERMYYQYQLDKKGSAFNLPMAWELEENIDLVKLEEALCTLIQRHESLRTSFILRDNQILQVIDEELVLAIQHAELPITGIESLIQPFDLSKAPLMRCYILSQSGGRKILFTDLHHIICDGMSQVNLFSDLLNLYRDADLSPLPIQYKDYAEWEQKFKLSEEYLGHRGFWLQAFETDLPKLNLPPLRHEDYGIKGGTVFYTMPYAEVEALLQTWKQADITVFSGLLSVYFLFLAQLSGQDDLIVGINSTGRMQDELEPVVGMFAKTLPIRYTLQLDLTFDAMVKQMHRHLREANSRQIYDYLDIINELNRNRKLPIDNLFDSMLVFQNFEHRDTHVGKQLFMDYSFRQTEAKYPLTLFVNTSEEGFRLRMEYQEAYFDAEEITQMLQKFEHLFIKLAQEQNIILAELMGVEPTDTLDQSEITFQF